MALIYLLSASISLVAILGDSLLNRLSDLHLRALTDSSTHGLIGLLSWNVVLFHSPSKLDVMMSPVFEAGLSFFLASVIDLDHFWMARSYSLKDAMSLGQQRPILHCTTIPIVLSLMCGLASMMLHVKKLARFGWMLLISMVSHHVRDGSRRGLWFWPFGSTPPIPYMAYLLALALLPHIPALFVSKYSSPTYENIPMII